MLFRKSRPVDARADAYRLYGDFFELSGVRQVKKRLFNPVFGGFSAHIAFCVHDGNSFIALSQQFWA